MTSTLNGYDAGLGRTVALTTVAARIIEQVSTRPDEVVVEDGVDRLTGSQFADRIYQLARALARHGVGPDHVLALIAPNVVDALAVRYAAGLVGAATVLCPQGADAQALAGFVAMVGADVVVVWESTAALARTATRAAGTRLVLGVGVVPGADVDLALAAGLEPSEPIPDRSDPVAPALFVTSGGTSGPSKASRRSASGWLLMVEGPADPSRRQLVCTPLAYIGQVLADQTLLAGGTLVLRPKFDPASVLQTIETKRITHLCLVEPLLVELVDHPDFIRRDVTSLVALSHVGAPAPQSLRRRLLRRTGPVLVHPYGASEAGIISVLQVPEYDIDRPELLTCAGRVLPGTRVQVRRADGSPATPGEPGELVLGSPRVADGYAQPVTNSGFRDDGYHPGDVAVLDRAGYLHVRGRAADRRHQRGREVFPVDVDDALCDHIAVRYAVTVPTETGFVTMAVTDGSGVTVADLTDHIRHHHGAHLVPERLVLVSRIPVTEQGKPDRAAILASVRSHMSEPGDTDESPL